MKWLFRLLTVLSVAAAIALPFYFESFLSGNDKANPAAVLSVTPDRMSSSSITRVYKWRDSSGTWQYSDHEPANASDLEIMEINNNVNILQSPRSEIVTETSSGKPSSAGSPDRIVRSAPDSFQIPGTGLPMILDGSAIRKAHEARELMEQRRQQLDELIER